MIPIVCNPHEALAITTADGTRIVIRFEDIHDQQARVRIDAPKSHIRLLDDVNSTRAQAR